MHNYKYPILAKPSGITLEQHRHDVMSEGALSLKLMPCAIEKYERKTGKKLSRRLNLVCKHHDDGKKSEKWQTACQKDYEAFLKWKATNNGRFIINDWNSCLMPAILMFFPISSGQHFA